MNCVNPSLRAAGALAFSLTLWAGAHAQEDVPAPAAEAGYLRKTFSEGFSADNVSVTPQPEPDKVWYRWNLFGWQKPSWVIAVNGDGTGTIKGTPRGNNGQIATMAVANPAQHRMVGRAFGGGAYIEATIAFDAGAVLQAGAAGGWPAFWSVPYELLTRDGRSDWPGQAPGYEQYIEVDFMEYNMAFTYGAPNVYGTDIHHFHGISGKTCKNWYCDHGKTFRAALARVPPDTNFAEFHRYGFLWVPATEIRPGLAQHYFDGLPVGTPIRWIKQPDATQPPPDGRPWAYALLDQLHLVLILGSGTSTPMQVKTVSVWQASDDNNLKF